MKMKEFGPRGARPWRPLRSANDADFSTGLDSDSEPLIQMSLGWRSIPKMGTVTIWETLHTGIRI